ncbi:MAG TPA: ROK family protein [Chloroflexota bacterium]|nr:ROK family protein [Chloroflexota bacterium]
MTENAADHVREPLIVAGDLGGTNFRVEARIGSTTVLSHMFGNVRDSGSIFPIIEKVVADLPSEPAAACFAIAGRVDQSGTKAYVTNLQWEVDASELERCGIGRHVTLLNDFEAVALGLSSVGADEVIPIRGESTQGDMVVLGPGTGLGVAFRLRTGSGYVVRATESGHEEWPARSGREWAIRQYLSARKGNEYLAEGFDLHDTPSRVSFEEIVSGRGLINVYNALCGAESLPRSGLVEGTISQDPAQAASAISAAARSGDPTCQQAFRIFFDGLAVLAGDLALQGVPGGVFIVGNIVRRNLDMFSSDRFLEVFDRKDPHEEMLRSTPVFIVSSPRELGVEGAAIRAMALFE